MKKKRVDEDRLKRAIELEVKDRLEDAIGEVRDAFSGIEKSIFEWYQNLGVLEEKEKLEMTLTASLKTARTNKEVNEVLAEMPQEFYKSMQYVVAEKIGEIQKREAEEKK